MAAWDYGAVSLARSAHYPLPAAWKQRRRSPSHEKTGVLPSGSANGSRYGDSGRDTGPDLDYWVR